MPLILKTIRDLSQTKSNYPICNKTSNLDPVIEYNKFAMLINKCQKPCNTIEYKGDVKKHEGWRAVKGLEVSMYFPSNEIKVQEEYLNVRRENMEKKPYSCYAEKCGAVFKNFS